MTVADCKCAALKDVQVRIDRKVRSVKASFCARVATV